MGEVVPYIAAVAAVLLLALIGFRAWLLRRPTAEELERRRRLGINQSGKMADGMAEAADTLRGLLNAEGENVRLGAARSILELGTKLRDAVEIEERLVELERRQEAMKR